MVETTRASFKVPTVRSPICQELIRFESSDGAINFVQLFYQSFDQNIWLRNTATIVVYRTEFQAFDSTQNISARIQEPLTNATLGFLLGYNNLLAREP
jgi:hypothetical protein